MWLKTNKTGFQPVSRAVEQILRFFPKGSKKGSLSKSLKRCKNGAKSKLYDMKLNDRFL